MRKNVEKKNKTNLSCVEKLLYTILCFASWFFCCYFVRKMHLFRYLWLSTHISILSYSFRLLGFCLQEFCHINQINTIYVRKCFSPRTGEFLCVNFIVFSFRFMRFKSKYLSIYDAFFTKPWNFHGLLLQCFAHFFFFFYQNNLSTIYKYIGTSIGYNKKIVKTIQVQIYYSI